MPVAEIQDILLGGGQPLELFGASVGADGSRVQVLTAQNTVDVLQAGSSEGERYPDPEHLVGAWLDERVLWRRTFHRRIDGGAAEGLQLPTPFLPVNRHQRQ